MGACFSFISKVLCLYSMIFSGIFIMACGYSSKYGLTVVFSGCLTVIFTGLGTSAISWIALKHASFLQDKARNGSVLTAPAEPSQEEPFPTQIGFDASDNIDEA